MVLALIINMLVSLFGNAVQARGFRNGFVTKAKSFSEDDLDRALPLSKASAAGRIPSVDRVVGLMPGFVYIFNHTSYSNDYSNKSVASYLGYSSEEIRSLGADMFMQIVHPEDHGILDFHIERIAALKDEASASVEYRVITKDGSERWLRSVDTVFDRSSNGRVLRHIGCASDITEEKQAQLRLKELNAELEEKVAARTQDLATLNSELEARIYSRRLELQDAVGELEQLTYIATHDMKVPLNNLRRLGLMLKDSVASLNADQAEQVHWINECSEQLSAKVKGLVSVSQIRLGDEPPQVRLDLSDVVSTAIETFEGRLVEGAVSTRLEIAGGMIVKFAHSELNSILLAVLDNAKKYAHPDRKLQIDIRAGEAEGRTWLSVTDNGTGLDMTHDRPKVFGLFQRAHKEPVGDGVSLYCAQRMLHRCGGAMTVSGQRGVGATFKITFPKEKAKE
jgi:PAS domain S-box-containing protein